MKYGPPSLRKVTAYCHYSVTSVDEAHCSKLEKVLDENVTPQFQYFPII